MFVRGIPTFVICGFPGIGKSFLQKKFPTKVRDLESSEYHWGSDKVLNSNWPQNYIKAVQNLKSSGLYRVCFTSSHKDVRDALHEAGIKYTNVYPEDTPEMKEIFMNRYKDRGSSEDFIKNMDENFSKYIEDMSNDPNAHKYVITKSNLDEWGFYALVY